MPEIAPQTGLATGTFALARVEEAGRRFNSLVRPDGEIVDISRQFPDTESLYGDWPRSFDALNDLNAREAASGRSTAAVRFLPPTQAPQIFGAGSNYRKHAAEMYTYNEGEYQKSRREGEDDEEFFRRNLEFVEQKRAKGMPFIWMATHGCLVGAYDDVRLPQIGSQHDWEAELCLVLAGNSPRFMTPDEAVNSIAGYTIINDMHTCELFSRSDIKWNADWIAKHAPSFKPVGPYVVPRQFVPNLDEVMIRLKVNGEIKQDWPANDMIFSPAQYVAYASERLPILPGDLLMTGSPPGNGAVHGQFLKPGDVMETAITGLGHQRNNLVAEDVGGRKPFFGLPPFEK